MYRGNRKHTNKEHGRTMLEMLMALLILGLISAGGYSGVRYALGLSQAWRAQAQVNQLVKDVMSLYAWQDSYATLSMRGSRGICNTIVSPGNQDCVITSPWNESITVEKGKSNASFKIVLHKTPRSICEHLLGMRFENVYMVQKSCTGGNQDIELLMDKNDRECPESCPQGYDCINGECRAQDREDLCKNVNCVGECLSGECRGGTCLYKSNGSSCSIGICIEGVCTQETTETTPETTPETTTPVDTTTTEEETTSVPSCGNNEIMVGGTCYSCNQYEPIYAWDKDALQGCPNRTISCGTVGTMDCNSYLTACPDGYIETGSDSCKTGEIPINDGSETGSGFNTGCCKEGLTDPCEEGNFRGLLGFCYPCSYASSASADAEHCAQCDGSSYPRIMFDNYCVLKKSCPIGQFLSINGCRDCSYQFNERSDAEQCSVCDSTDYQRLYENGLCVLKKECPEGQFWASGKCYDCSYQNSVTTIPKLCDACNNTSYPRVSMGNNLTYCVLKKNCPEGQYLNVNGCVACSTATGGYSLPEYCSACDITSYPRITLSENFCALKKECPIGQFLTASGCKDCATTATQILTSSEFCALCDNTSTPRKMNGTRCVLQECPKGYYMNYNECYSCTDKYARISDAEHCAVCDDTSSPREMSGESCILKCEAGKFFAHSYGCLLCSDSRGVGAKAQQCADCDNTDYPREMSGSMCVLKSI